MDESRISGLPENELEELAERIIYTICRERPDKHNKLNSSDLRDMLVEEGIEPPDFAMHDVLHQLNGVLTFGLGGPQNPHTDPEARLHGGITIYGFDRNICAM